MQKSVKDNKIKFVQTTIASLKSRMLNAYKNMLEADYKEDSITSKEYNRGIFEEFQDLLSEVLPKYELEDLEGQMERIQWKIWDEYERGKNKL
jgi:hypothetical protein